MPSLRMSIQARATRACSEPTAIAVPSQPVVSELIRGQMRHLIQSEAGNPTSPGIASLA
jgi:hypothetical protein